MPANELMQLASDGDVDAFELRCLEALESGALNLPELVQPFARLDAAEDKTRIASLGQMMLENAGAADAPQAALSVGLTALLAQPKNTDLRDRVVDLYRQVYSSREGFDALLEASGLAAGRPARIAVRMIELCISLKPGDVLASRTEDAVMEVVEADLAQNVFMLRRGGRKTTIAGLELSREYERIDPDDFRVLRQLRPDRLCEVIQSDPVKVVIGVIHAHGEMIGQDVLKRELVPRYLDPKAWTKWWTRCRGLLKRCPNVVIEGRAPVHLSYIAQGRSLEDEVWDEFCSLSDPEKRLATTESYLREKKARKEEPDADLLKRMRSHFLEQIETLKQHRASEALAAALAVERIEKLASMSENGGDAPADVILREANNPLAMLRQLPPGAMWSAALDRLESARSDAARTAVDLIIHASAAHLSQLARLAHSGDLLEEVQTHIDEALTTPLNYPELIFWLWKGPADVEGVELPTADDLFKLMIDTLAALGRTLTAEAAVVKRFRQRIKAALSLRDHAKALECIERISAGRGVTLRTQIERLEGLGENTPARLLEKLRDVHPQLWHTEAVVVQPWEDEDVLWVTRHGINRRTAERDQLVNVEMHENAKRIGEAASHGDLSENSEYKFALEERDLLRARLAQMNRELSLAEPIEPDDVPTDHVGIGSKVTLRQTSDGHTREMTFLGPFDTDIDAGIYNYQAPVSQTLLGLHVGDKATVVVDGRDVVYEVAEIKVGLTAD